MLGPKGTSKLVDRLHTLHHSQSSGGRPCLGTDLAAANPHRHESYCSIHHNVRVTASVLDVGGEPPVRPLSSASHSVVGALNLLVRWPVPSHKTKFPFALSTSAKPDLHRRAHKCTDGLADAPLCLLTSFSRSSRAATPAAMTSRGRRCCARRCLCKQRHHQLHVSRTPWCRLWCVNARHRSGSGASRVRRRRR